MREEAIAAALRLERDAGVKEIEDLTPIASDAHYLRVGFGATLKMLCVGFEAVVCAIYETRARD